MAISAQKLKSFRKLLDLQKLNPPFPQFLGGVNMMEVQGGIIGMESTSLTCPSEFFLKLRAKNFFPSSPLNFLALGTDIVPSLISNVRKFFAALKAKPITLQVYASAFVSLILIGDTTAARTTPLQEQTVSAKIRQAIRATWNFL